MSAVIIGWIRWRQTLVAVWEINLKAYNTYIRTCQQYWHVMWPDWELNCSHLLKNWHAQVYHLLSNFNSHYPGGPGLAGTRMSPFWFLLELRVMEVVSGDNWSYKTCRAPVKLSLSTNQHPVFYRPDAIPATQPTVLKCWRESAQPYHNVKYCFSREAWWTSKLIAAVRMKSSARSYSDDIGQALLHVVYI